MAIFKGYDILIDVVFNDRNFPPGATFFGSVAVEPGPARTLLGRVSTALGTVTRLSATTLQIKIPGAVNAKAPALTCYLDLVRTDGAVPEPLAQFKINMTRPITQESEA